MVQIKVTPEMLEEVANRASNTRIALESIHNNLCNEIDRLCFQWIGASNQQFIHMFNDAKPKAFTSINSIIQVEEDLKRIAKKFRTADISYDGNLEEGAMCGPLNSKKNDGSLRDKVWHGLKETYKDLSKVKNADESLYDKFKHGVDAAYKDVNKIKDAIDDEIESTFEKAGLGVPYHFKKGMGDAIGDELLGLADSVIHPIDTFNNTIEALSHPVDTFNSIKQTISDSWNRDVTNGDSYSGAEWYGSATGHTILAVGQLFVGTKGVDKIAMLKPDTKLAEISRTANQSLQDAASLFNRNHNEFALAGGNNIRSVFDTPDFRQAEEKLSTHQFANGENTTTVKPGDSSSLAPEGGLAAHEASGGHLLERHVGKTDAELLQRMENDTRITGSSTFTDRATAEKVANATLSDPNNQRIIRDWLNNPRSRSTIALDYYNNDIIGRGIQRGSTTAHDMKNAKIVLKKDGNGNFILTGYPVD
ncbi:WXG100 family type VII secretion target [Bacillus nitratireducens]|uniref:WXG100 family type VII secretion target n=1 Tax=Bacillus nitratireducens TaxID=2026193 RepID=UPI001F599087|nr:WXG100 family type VII secretion target [Bacillus nitratireducens]UNP78488.1 WXG100 family type VII secretion target [Bacillus nitratireducens]